MVQSSLRLCRLNMLQVVVCSWRAITVNHIHMPRTFLLTSFTDIAILLGEKGRESICLGDVFIIFHCVSARVVFHCSYFFFQIYIKNIASYMKSIST